MRSVANTQVVGGLQSASGDHDGVFVSPEVTDLLEGGQATDDMARTTARIVPER